MTSRSSYSVRRLAFLFLAFLLLLGVVACASCRPRPEPTPPPPSRHLTILSFNDLHGSLTPFNRFYGEKELSGGFARMAALVKRIRAENAAKGADTLVVSGGDNLQGTPVSTAFKGEAEVAAFNALPLDASVVGNHDFAYGYSNILHLQAKSVFPWLSANVLEKNDNRVVFSPYTILTTAHGLRVGLLGVTTEETPITTHPANVSTLRFVRPELAVRRYLPEVRGKSDILILLSHAGVKEDRELAQSFPEISVIVGGHTHTQLDEPLRIGPTIITQTGDRGLHLGRLDLEIDSHGVHFISYQLIPIRDHIADDPDMKGVIDTYMKRLEVEIGKTVGEAKVLLLGERTAIRNQETNLGNFIADLMRHRGEADVAFINSGAIRASIQPGPITLGQVMSVLPMNNTLFTFTLSGRQLQDVVRHSVEGMLNGGAENPFGGFLQTSGLIVTMQGNTLDSILVNGQPLDLERTYHCASIDFLMAGGDGYGMLKDAEQVYDTGINLRDLFIGALTHPIDARVDGRFVRF